MPSPLISKTSFLAGVQCRKLIWKKLRDPEGFPPVDEARQSLFDQGHTIGNLAKTLYPGGIEVGEGVVFYQPVLDETATLLDRRAPLYEPAFSFEGGYARIDLLVPDRDDSWRIVEVKSGTSVKDEHLLDLAFQLHLCRGAGLTVTRCALMHVDNAYVRQGDIDPIQLLVEEDVTDAIVDLLPTIPPRLAELRSVVAQDTCPEVAIGAHCGKPYACDLKPQCWHFLPDYPVTDLAGDSGGKRWKFLEAGIQSLADIPDPDTLNARQRIQVEVARSDAPHLDLAQLRTFLGTLKWPLAYFDIETTSCAIPFYDGTRPYQQVPFQFSLHLQEEEGGPIAHHEFLAEGQNDPRPAFLDALQSVLPARGTVVSYNASFENRCLRDCAEAFPAHAWAAGIPARNVDLLVPFRSFSYHHRDQHGSASLKSVLPVLAGTDYSHLAIQDGNAAARSFTAAEITEGRKEERDRIRKDLLAYCKLDTQAMIDLVDALKALTAP